MERPRKGQQMPIRQSVRNAKSDPASLQVFTSIANSVDAFFDCVERDETDRAFMTTLAF
jgi:hypothetical protein